VAVALSDSRWPRQDRLYRSNLYRLISRSCTKRVPVGHATCGAGIAPVKRCSGSIQRSALQRRSARCPTLQATEERYCLPSGAVYCPIPHKSLLDNASRQRISVTAPRGRSKCRPRSSEKFLFVRHAIKHYFNDYLCLGESGVQAPFPFAASPGSFSQIR
jgi:hypothetical protein